MASKMMSLFFYVVLLVAFNKSTAQTVPAVFMFGDSLIDVGNNNHLLVPLEAKANYPHHGVDFPGKKATGRFCNGKNLADFIAEKVGLPASPPPYRSLMFKDVSAFMTGVSFAFAGAGIFNFTYPFLGPYVSLTQQVGDYEAIYGKMVQQLGPSDAQNLLSKSLFCIVIGTNDIISYSSSSDPNKGTPQQLYDRMSDTLKQLITRIYNKGGRKFSVVGVPPIGCTPLKRNKQEPGAPCDEQLNSMAVSYNANLKTMLNELGSLLHGFSYSFFDAYSSTLHIIQSPSSYGFMIAKEACCGVGELGAAMPCFPTSKLCSNRRNHVFWDFVHPTEAAAKIIVDDLFDGQHSSPINLRKLVTS